MFINQPYYNNNWGYSCVVCGAWVGGKGECCPSCGATGSLVRYRTFVRYLEDRFLREEGAAPLFGDDFEDPENRALEIRRQAAEYYYQEARKGSLADILEP